MLYNFLLVDICTSYLRTLPQAKIPVTKGIFEENLVFQVFLVWLHAVRVYASLNLAHILASLMSVTLGLYQPCEWPPLFGSLTDAYTVRRLWG
jgi:hypothetical protein